MSPTLADILDDLEVSTGGDWFEVDSDCATTLLDYIRVLRSAIEAVEWIENSEATNDDESQHCPWCGNWIGDGHKSDCERQRALTQSAV